MTNAMKIEATDKTFKLVMEYVDEVLAGFHHDPADTDYQKGYKNAYEEMNRMLKTMRSAARKDK